jgi:ribosomal protein S18 acetylase RimI-like enzyme
MTTLRTANADDLAAVVALWGRAAGPTRLAGQLAEAEALMRRDPQALLIAESQGRVIGTLIAGWDGWRCHLYRLAVDHSVRRTGVAVALVAMARERAAVLGATRLDAMVARENAAGVAFWSGQGFDEDLADGRWSLLLA